MLTLVEKLLFIAAAALSVGLTLRSAERIRRVIRRGPGSFSLRGVVRRLVPTLVNTVFQRITFKTRFGPSLAHILVVWGFTYYLLVNIGDVLQAMFPGFVFLGRGLLGGFYRLGADLLSVAILIGVGSLVLRRWLFGRRIFGFLEFDSGRGARAPGHLPQFDDRGRVHPAARRLAFPRRELRSSRAKAPTRGSRWRVWRAGCGQVHRARRSRS